MGENMKRLKDFIFKENKLITCRTLSTELKLHINVAKQCMSEFLAQYSERNHLSINYLLIGIQESDEKKFVKISVVSKENLEKEKELLSEVTSCHLYSLSKNKIDEISLYNTGKECSNAEENIQYSAIRHPTVHIQPKLLSHSSSRNTDTELIKKQVSTVTSCSKQSEKQNSKTSKTEQNGSDKVPAESPKTTNVSECISETKKTVSDKPKGGAKNGKLNSLTSMWQKKEDKSQNSDHETPKPESKGKAKSSADNSKKVPKNNIMSMFSKQMVKIANNPPKQEVSTLKCKTEEPSPKKKDIVKSVAKEESVIDKKSLKTYSSKRKTADRHARNSSKKSSDNELDDFQSKKKKHRRICTFDTDTESENEEDQDMALRKAFMSEDPIETLIVKSKVSSGEDEEPIPPTPPVRNGPARKRIMKTVMKTYEDEDGFFVTKQEKEFVSEDDDEDPLPKKSFSGIDLAQTKLFTNRKQASLTSFFKQK